MRTIFTGLLLLAAMHLSAQSGTRKITLEDIWRDNTFRVKSVPGFNAMKDGRHYTQLDKEGKDQSVGVYDLLTGRKTGSRFSSEEQVLPDSLGAIIEYAFSDNEEALLLFFKAENIYRRSILHYVLVFTNGWVLLDKAKVLHPTFSPDGTKVAFVKDNDLYYRDLKSGVTVAVTTDGQRNCIINGNSDWVYEEEFSFTRAFQWSPDSRSLAYYRFDERSVPEYTMTVYDSLYPTPYKYKYPKAGEPNSIVDIKLYNLATRKTVTANVGPETDQYIPRIKWTTDPSKLCILRMNRRQNKLNYLLTDAATGRSETIFTETNKAYINVTDNLRFLEDGASFLCSSEMYGYNQLFIRNWKTRKLTVLTDGQYDVESITGVDEAARTVYYTSAEASPMDRRLYAVGFDGRNKRCLTPEKGTHAITLCEGNRYFLDKYSTLTAPPVYSLRDASGKIIRTLEDNSTLKAKMKEYSLGDIKLVKVQGATQKLNAWLITPPDFSEDEQYPVLMFQYSGPNSQQVVNKFPIADFFWHQMLTQQGYIIVCVDGTGTGFRGEEFRKRTYKQLGRYESDDQIAAARYLSTLPYIDKSRIGIWGWSYGGFIASTCIFKGADVFKMAIAVAPVSNWRYYDNIYTERYMQRPQENEQGYDENAPEKMTAKLKGSFLLIHGTGDDNVHFQNSVMMMNNLIRDNKGFDSEYYPNRAHGISGGNTRLHLYRRMTQFIQQNL
jgi:dipeptidyl-peptidase-4